MATTATADPGHLPTEIASMILLLLPLAAQVTLARASAGMRRVILDPRRRQVTETVETSPSTVHHIPPNFAPLVAHLLVLMTGLATKNDSHCHDFFEYVATFNMLRTLTLSIPAGAGPTTHLTFCNILHRYVNTATLTRLILTLGGGTAPAATAAHNLYRLDWDAIASLTSLTALEIYTDGTAKIVQRGGDNLGRLTKLHTLRIPQGATPPSLGALTALTALYGHCPQHCFGTLTAEQIQGLANLAVLKWPGQVNKYIDFSVSPLRTLDTCLNVPRGLGLVLPSINATLLTSIQLRMYVRRVLIVPMGQHLAQQHDLWPLTRLTNLEHIALDYAFDYKHRTTGAYINALAHLQRLRTVRLGAKMRLTDVNPLGELPELEEVELLSRDPLNTSALARCGHIKRVTLATLQSDIGWLLGAHTIERVAANSQAFRWLCTSDAVVQSSGNCAIVNMWDTLQVLRERPGVVVELTDRGLDGY